VRRFRSSTRLKSARNITILIAKGNFDYLAYQADQTLTVNVNPVSDKELAQRDDVFKYKGEKLSLNFQDIEVRSVLQLIADFTDLNLVASDTVSGRITLRLKNVPWDQALELILKTKGLDKRQVGNAAGRARRLRLPRAKARTRKTSGRSPNRRRCVPEFIQSVMRTRASWYKLFSGSGGGKPVAQAGGRGFPWRLVRGGRNSIVSARGSVIVDEAHQLDHPDGYGGSARRVPESDRTARHPCSAGADRIADRHGRARTSIRSWLRWGGASLTN
jgi:type IV pilus assembly protein PilQ